MVSGEESVEVAAVLVGIVGRVIPKQLAGSHFRSDSRHFLTSRSEEHALAQVLSINFAMAEVPMVRVDLFSSVAFASLRASINCSIGCT